MSKESSAPKEEDANEMDACGEPHKKREILNQMEKQAFHLQTVVCSNTESSVPPHPTFCYTWGDNQPNPVCSGSTNSTQGTLMGELHFKASDRTWECTMGYAGGQPFFRKEWQHAAADDKDGILTNEQLLAAYRKLDIDVNQSLRSVLQIACCCLK